MENYRLQERDGMQIRITNACVKANQYDDTGKIRSIWRNFAGVPTNLNPRGGNREFTIDLNRKGNRDAAFMIEFGNDTIGWRPVGVQDLIDMGWRISMYDARERHPDVNYNEDYTPNANLNVVVAEHDKEHSYMDPKVFQYMGDRVFKMVFHPDPMKQDEQPIDILDNLWFDRVQVRLNHSKNNKAYLESMHIYPRIQNVNYDDWAR